MDTAGTERHRICCCHPRHVRCELRVGMSEAQPDLSKQSPSGIVGLRGPLPHFKGAAPPATRFRPRQTARCQRRRSSRGVNHRSALPSPLSSALRLSNASRAMSLGMCTSRAASRACRSLSLMGSWLARTMARALSAAPRASLSDTEDRDPSPISRRRPWIVKRNIHWPPPSGRFCNQSPPPSQYFPDGSVRAETAESLFRERDISHPPLDPPFASRRADIQ
ncbi:hypothetical protein ABIE08_002841 [Kaistia defluvii]|uniref:Uncharacterized protein n=1 Tax=Kaistia defluvii TaxID=410841 RepID=A0ABV2R0U3_9HYPH